MIGFSKISTSSPMNDNYPQYGGISLKTEGLPEIIAPDCPPEIVVEKSEGLVENLTLQVNAGLLSKVNKAFWIGMGSWGTYNLIDTGLAMFLSLETLTHGAGPHGYIGINMNGADPNYGGGSTGSSAGSGLETFIENSKNYFHLFKDSELSNSRDPLIFTGLTKILPRMHAIFSGIATFKNSGLNLDNFSNTILGGISGFITPTLKFRFTPEEILNCHKNCRFEDDPDYHRMAYRTSQPISPSHLGITGSISQGVNFGMLNRMSANPAKVIVGMALLGAAAVVAKKTYQYAKSYNEEMKVKNLTEDTKVAVNLPEDTKITVDLEDAIVPETSLNTYSITSSIKEGVKILAASSSLTNLALATKFMGTRSVKILAVKAGWATLAVTAVFLNTM